MRVSYLKYNKEFIDTILSKEDIIKLDSIPAIISTSESPQIFEYEPVIEFESVKNKNINHDENKND